jgi:hypothetical protein
MKKTKYFAAALIALVGLGLQQAKADTTSFNLSVGNPAIAGFPGPYATVLVNRTDATHATITFTSLTNPNGGTPVIYMFGDGSSVAVNVNAATWGVSNITFVQPAGFSDPLIQNGGSGNVDGFGVLNQTFNSFDGFTHASTQISFTLTNTSGTWGSAGAVLIANGQGALAAAHIFVTLDPPNTKNGALATGFAANGGSQVPDGGATVMLLGVALGALGVVRRYLSN